MICGGTKKKLTGQRFIDILCIVFNILWVIFSIVLMGYRTSTIKDDEQNMLSHFTNWNWLILTSFLLLDTITFFDIKNEIFLFYLGIAFWPTWTSCWEVFWLVILVLANNPSILLENAKAFGGDYDTGLVLVMDRIIHVLIIVVMFSYFICRLRFLIEATNLMYFKTRGYGRKIFFVVWNIFSIPLVIGIYVSVFNVKTNYGFTWNLGYLFLEAILVLSIFTVIPFVVVFLFARDFNSKK
jgi:hypothetical protein